MRSSGWGVKQPEKFIFTASLVVAEKFRKHCAENQYKYGKVLEDLMIEYLIKEGVIKSRVVLSLERLERGELT